MKKEEVELKWMLYFTLFYLLIFTVISLINKNFEFLYYTIVMSTLIIFIVLYHKKLHLSTAVIGGLTLVGAMHVFGGNIYIAGTRLYDFWLIQGILKYDNLVHFVAIFFTTFIAYSLLHPHLDKKMNHNMFLLSLILVLIAKGAGAFNEILEFGAVIFLGAAEQVGDYMNNAIDLIFNLLGALSASIYLMYYHNKNYKKKK